MKRLGLARGPEDPLCSAVRAAGWEPVPLFVTTMAATGLPPPAADADGLLLLSPAAARLALIPPGMACLAQGEATARALAERGAGTAAPLVSASPRAEGLFELLQAHFPAGGTFLLARGERSREHLEAVAAGTRWRLLSWITHREAPVRPEPPLPELDAVLALSPLQAELLGPRCGHLLRFAWGQRTHQAFRQAGYPGHGCCEPEPGALRQLLSAPTP